MNNLTSDYELEVILVSRYCKIVETIISNHKELSVCKLICYSYLLNQELVGVRSVYKGNTKEDIVHKSISQLSGNFSHYCDSLKYIVRAIHILKKHEKIEIHNIVKHSINNMTFGELVEESTFIFNAIEASKLFSDRQFMKEVLQNV